MSVLFSYNYVVIRIQTLIKWNVNYFYLTSPVLYLYINLACLSVCLFVFNKRQNGWTDRAQIFCGTSRDPREGLWMIKFSKICLHQNSIFENFENPRIFFWKSAKFFFFYLFTRRNPVYFIFTNEIKYMREAPKSLERRARSALNF